MMVFILEQLSPIHHLSRQKEGMNGRHAWGSAVLTIALSS